MSVSPVCVKKQGAGFRKKPIYLKFYLSQAKTIIMWKHQIIEIVSILQVHTQLINCMCLNSWLLSIDKQFHTIFHGIRNCLPYVNEKITEVSYYHIPSNLEILSQALTMSFVLIFVGDSARLSIINSSCLASSGRAKLL